MSRTPAPPTITAAALRLGELTLSLPAPARHHDLFRVISQIGLGLPIASVLAAEQGFLTSRGRFVDRKSALEIANTAKQISKKQGSKHELYSEDIW